MTRDQGRICNLARIAALGKTHLGFEKDLAELGMV